MLLGLESPFDKSFLGSDLVQRHQLAADSDYNRCGARLRAGRPALRIRTGRVATSSEGKDSGSGVRYSFRQQ
jgi:hypothetical protein